MIRQHNIISHSQALSTSLLSLFSLSFYQSNYLYFYLFIYLKLSIVWPWECIHTFLHLDDSIAPVFPKKEGLHFWDEIPPLRGSSCIYLILGWPLEVFFVWVRLLIRSILRISPQKNLWNISNKTDLIRFLYCNLQVCRTGLISIYMYTLGEWFLF